VAFAVMSHILSVCADKGYDAERHCILCRTFGAGPYIHRRGQPQGSGLGSTSLAGEAHAQLAVGEQRAGPTP
jgi:hypothetical protein